MIKDNNSSKEFNQYINEAVDYLHKYEFEKSYKLIVIALNTNPNAPQPHNLLGIWYEFIGDKDLAKKHYRAAYALDPTFRPACVNLERVCTSCINSVPIDYGEIN